MMYSVSIDACRDELVAWNDKVRIAEPQAEQTGPSLGLLVLAGTESGRPRRSVAPASGAANRSVERLRGGSWLKSPTSPGCSSPKMSTASL